MEKNYSFEGSYYNVPGTADDLISSIPEGEDSPALLISKSTLSYLRGDIGKALEYVRKAEKSKELTFSNQLTIYLMLGVCAMYRGNIALWEEARRSIACIPCENQVEQEVVEMWLGGHDSHIHIHGTFPDWFCKGRFDVIPPQDLPIAQVLYARYQFIKYKNSRLDNSDKAKRGEKDPVTIPEICEPIISMIRGHSVVSEMRLRLICAVGYRMQGKEKDASYHIHQAIALARPDRIYAPLAEYRGQLDYFFDDILRETDEEAFAEVKKITSVLYDGWAKIHNYITGRKVAIDLSLRESEVARLAAFGFSNVEIADRLHISINTVRTHLQKVYEKTGVGGREELKDYII